LDKEGIILLNQQQTFTCAFTINVY
jgi:hypothetical protein